MFNDFVFYSYLLAAALFTLTWFVTKKDKGIAWGITAVVGVLVISFVFPSSQSAPDLAGLMSNATLAISKILYVLAWGGGAFTMHKIL